MNPLTNMKNVLKLSENDLKTGGKNSWHNMYKDSAWIFVGGLPYDLTEGDVLSVFSQYGEIVNINMIRDKVTGKPKGFCFICYEDQRSTILSVDNLNGIKILGRTIRVDHVAEYKVPKENDKTDEDTRRLYMEGCAPKVQIPVEHIKREKVDTFKAPNNPDQDGIRLPPRLPIGRVKSEQTDSEQGIKSEKKSKKNKKEKKQKKDKKSKKKKKKKYSSSSASESSSDDSYSGSGSKAKSETNQFRNNERSPARDKSSRDIRRSRSSDEVRRRRRSASPYDRRGDRSRDRSMRDRERTRRRSRSRS